jgi:hypothetical protein
MGFKNHNLNNLFKALHAVYLEKENVQPDIHFKSDVMRQIRSLEQQGHRGAFFQTMEQLTWKLAPATALMILIFSYALMNFEFISDWQVLQLITNGTEEIGLFEFLT